MMRTWKLSACTLAGVGLLAALLAAATSPLSPSAPAEATGQRPNIVFVMVDDMRADDLRYMPRTRRLLGGAGVTFANGLAPHPVCCPARASVLTGWYTHNHRVFTVKDPYAFPALPDRSTIATWLRGSGYSTHYIGKYLNGYGELPEPGKTRGSSIHYKPPGWAHWRGSIDGGLGKDHWANGGTYRYYNTTLSVDGRTFANYKGRYQSEVFGTLSTRTIERRQDKAKPFFLYVSYAAPHHGLPKEGDDPLSVRRPDGTTSKIATPARPRGVRGIYDDLIRQAPGADWDPSRTTRKPEYLRRNRPFTVAERDALREVTRQRAEALAVVDRQVGRTVAALAETGQLDETLVIFTSDNGFFLGEQGIRVGKNLPHDPALRVPVLMRGPSIPAGEVRYDPFLMVDFAPTIAEAANVPVGHEVDGVSMLDVARNGDQGWSRAVLTSTGPGKPQRSTDEAGDPLASGEHDQRDLRWAIGVRTPRYLYVDLATGEEELYDVITDPGQLDNLAGRPRYAEVQDLLRAELDRVRACDGPTCRAPMDPSLQSVPR